MKHWNGRRSSENPRVAEAIESWKHPQRLSNVMVVTSALMLAVLGGAAPARSQDAPVIAELDQGWSDEWRNEWYGTSQGSRLIPLAWLRALEQPDNQSAFMDPEHVAKFRYLPLKVNGEQLAVGFVIDTSSDSNLQRTHLRWKAGQSDQEPWVGMTCAACHTSELTFQGKRMRIDGGSALADFQSFIETLNKALEATITDDGKWDRFAKQVLSGADDTTANRASLKQEFRKLLDWQELEASMNKTDLVYGFSRVDAFGHIFNKVALIAFDNVQSVGQAGGPKPNPSDAPVSIPFIWRAPQLDRVQYNGIAPKYTVFRERFDIGALARNTGEAIGVFGDIKTRRNPGLSGFQSSIDVVNLQRLEMQLKTLRPPKWPASIFGAPDPALVSEGEALYKTHCAGCHTVLDRTNLTEHITVRMSLFSETGVSNGGKKPPPPPGTDVWMACNAYDYSSASGNLEGLRSGYVLGAPIARDAPLSSLLGATVAGTLVGKKLEVTQAAAEAVFGRPRRLGFGNRAPAFIGPNPRRSAAKTAQLSRCLNATSPLLGYTSRPLNGIWATAPYLHNGSVPTLYALLLPASQRPKQFRLGTREYDPKDVGYVQGDVQGNTFVFRTQDDDGNTIDGNSNAGHEYDNNFSDLSPDVADRTRRAIIEYLKTL